MAIRTLRAIILTTPSVRTGNDFDSQLPAAIKEASFYGASLHDESLGTYYFI
jgi:hypothetical protein